MITIINFTLQQPTENGGTGIEGIYLDQKGILRNEKGNIIDKEGNILDGETGEIIESKHYTLDEKGYIIGENNNDPFNVYSFVEFKLDLNEDCSGSHRVSIGPRTNNCLVIKEIILDFSKNPFVINKVSLRREVSSGGQIYDLSFVSPEAVKNTKKRIYVCF